MTMNVVRQEEMTGCGLACVAIVTSKSYAEVKAHANGIGIFADDVALYSGTAFVRQLLATYGVGLSNEEKPFSSWAALPRKALLAIKYHLERDLPMWHWVVYERDGDVSVVLDPAKHLPNNRRTDFDAMQPKWFIEIEKV